MSADRSTLCGVGSTQTAMAPSSSALRSAIAITLAGGALALSGCKSDEPRRAPPPPKAASSAGACDASKPAVADAASAPFFPGKVQSFCIDPNGGDKAFGEGAPLPLDGICDLFDGECEIYKGFGVRRVVDARYVDGGGSAATIDVHLSKFATGEGAYAMFTQRVVGDGDPAGEDAPRPIEGGSAAALGVGIAYLYRGVYLAELTYADPAASEATTRAQGDKLLPELAKSMGDKLPGEIGLPLAASRLPKEHLVPLGIRYVTGDLLGVEGVGAGALGYYKDGEKRYRMSVIVRPDIEQAKDVLGTFGKVPGAIKEKNLGEGAFRFTRKAAEGGIPLEWVVARSGKAVIGVGDEETAIRAGMNADEVAKRSLGQPEKIERLKKAL